MSMQPIELPTLPPVAPSPAPSPQRDALMHRAKLLAWIGVGWYAIEATIAIVAGLTAGSIAMIGFGPTR